MESFKTFFSKYLRIDTSVSMSDKFLAFSQAVGVVITSGLILYIGWGACSRLFYILETPTLIECILLISSVIGIVTLYEHFKRKSASKI